MAKTRVKMDSAGARELLSSPKVAAHLESLGERVAAAMGSTAPVESGALAASHRVEAEQHGDRVVVRVGSDLDYAAAIAVATGYMARALDAAGGP